MRIIEDPQHVLSRWKAEVSTYPNALRNAILGRFVREEAFWPENPHYKSAVERSDVIYTSAIVQQVLHILFQVLFALTRVYFPGEKKLADALEALPRQPARLGTRVQALLTEYSGLDAQGLREQHRELGELVANVTRLVAAHGDRVPARPNTGLQGTHGRSCFQLRLAAELGCCSL